MDDGELFLPEPHVAALSVWTGQDRGSWTMPSGISTRRRGAMVDPRRIAIGRLIRTAERFILMVQRVAPTVRNVSVGGWQVLRFRRPMSCCRRAPPATRPSRMLAHIDLVETALAKQVTIYLRPTRWLTADLGPGAVPPGAR